MPCTGSLNTMWAFAGRAAMHFLTKTSVDIVILYTLESMLKRPFFVVPKEEILQSDALPKSPHANPCYIALNNRINTYKCASLCLYRLFPKNVARDVVLRLYAPKNVHVFMKKKRSIVIRKKTRHVWHCIRCFESLIL